ncbi:MAG: PEP-CTERM sorting domain-containing protein [Phycisphaeraceae bacterium]
MQRFTLTMLGSCFTVGMLTFGGAGIAQAAIETQDFSSDPSADGWTGLNNGASGFGFSAASNNTLGDPAGEAGGTFARNTVHYYADTTLGTTYGVFDSVQASGELYLDKINGDTVNYVGYFDTNNVNPSDDTVLGLRIAPDGLPDRNTVMATAFGGDFIEYNNDGTNDTTNSRSVILDDGAYAFQMTYTANPLGDGNPVPNPGTLEVILWDDNGTEVARIYNSLGLNQDRSARAFNAFGFFGGGNGAFDNSGTNTYFIDDLAYTSAIPEPASLALLGVGGLTLLLRRRHAAA